MNIPGFITRNFRLKLGCAVMAAVTWVGVVYAGNPPETRTVSLAVPQARSAIPAQFVLVSPVPNLAVRIGGSRSNLDSFNTSSLLVNVAWGKVSRAGNVAVPISIVNTNPNVELIDPPASIAADIDTQDSVSLPVTIKVTNPPPLGYVISSESSSPSSVAVVGPHRQLTGIAADVTVDLQNRKTNLVSDLAVLVYDAQGAEVSDLSSVTPNIVTVTVTVASSLTSRASAVVPKTVGSVGAGHQLVGIEVSPATVALTGPQDLLNALDSIATASISLNGLTGTVTVNVGLAPPPGVTATPTSVAVTIVIGTLPTPPPSPTPSATPSPTPSPTH